MLNLSLDLPRNTSSSSDPLSLCVLLYFMKENCQPLTLSLLFLGQNSRNFNSTPSLHLSLFCLKPALTHPETQVPTPEYPQGAKPSLGNFPFPPLQRPMLLWAEGIFLIPRGTAALTTAQGAPGTGGAVTHGKG